MGIFFGGAKISNIFFGVLIFLRVNGPEPTYEVKLRVPPPPPLGSSWSECQNVPASTKK